MIAFLTEKIVITVLLLLFSLVCTFLPWVLHRYMKRATSLMSLLTCLASGVIIGAFFFHILPHTMDGHDHSVHVHDKVTMPGNASGHDHGDNHHDADSHDHGDHVHGHCAGHSHQQRRSSSGPLSSGSSGSFGSDFSSGSSPSNPFIGLETESTPRSMTRSVGNHDVHEGHDHDHDHDHEEGHSHSDHSHSHPTTPSTPDQSDSGPHAHPSQAHSGQGGHSAHHSHSHPGHSHSHSHNESDHSDHDHAHNHSHSDHSHSHAHGTYPWGAFCAGASFFFLLIVDRGLMTHNHCPKVSPDAEAKPSEPSQQRHAPYSESTEPLQTSEKQAPLYQDLGALSTPSSLPVPTPIPAPPVEDDCQSCHSSIVLGACHMDAVNERTSKMQAFLFVLVLSIHSFLEGLAMNSNRTLKDLIMFTVALGLHKLLESFALGVSVFKAHFQWRLSLALGVFYSILTPIGILCSLANKSPSRIVEQVLNGLAAGSFLFVATLEMITPEFHKTDKTTSYKLMMASLGFALMAAVAVFDVFFHSH